MHLPLPAAQCVACRLRREVCLCHEADLVDADLRLIVVLHAEESRRMSNTGHLATLVVRDSRIALHGWQNRPAELAELRETHAPDGRPWRTLLLYPGFAAAPLTPSYAAALRAPDASGARPRLRLVFPDGTWSQARRMVKRLPELAALPRAMLPASAHWDGREAMRPRGNPVASRVSTCEAIAAVLGAVGETRAEAALFRVYDAAALRIALMRGRLRLEGHRGVLRAP
jgi:DTW domain-containing protein YfiP